MIGSGKSTLSTILGNVLDVPVFYESVDDNPVLPLFYKDPNKYAFLLQIYFLNTRFKSMKKATTIKNAIMDRSIREDAILFHANAELGRVGETKEDSDTVIDTYDNLLNNMLEELDTLPKKTPDLVIGIRASYETIVSRIQKRGRSYEQISQDGSLINYYKLLIERYDEWFDAFKVNNPNSDIIIIDGDKYDFTENENDRKLVLSAILNKMNSIGLIDDVEKLQDSVNPSQQQVHRMLDLVADTIN